MLTNKQINFLHKVKIATLRINFLSNLLNNGFILGSY